jgi:hypothetical protein
VTKCFRRKRLAPSKRRAVAELRHGLQAFDQHRHPGGEVLVERLLLAIAPAQDEGLVGQRRQVARQGGALRGRELGQALALRLRPAGRVVVGQGASSSVTKPTSPAITVL